MLELQLHIIPISVYEVISKAAAKPKFTPWPSLTFLEATNLASLKDLATDTCGSENSTVGTDASL